ncbi:MAG: ABC transporter ATP-binding protein/permease [Actinomycetota bacterium]|nr:ABC transporter ATP-binding protein/permease [Actinomycetota bacterium]
MTTTDQNSRPDAGAPEDPAAERDWRGIATEDVDDLPSAAGVFLRARSRRLLGELVRPHRRQVRWLLLVILVQNLAWLAGPWLVGLGIDNALPALMDDGSVAPLIWIGSAMLLAAGTDAILRYAFLQRTGAIGQDMLLTLRRRVFSHVQRLPLAFHERYTSGRVISRLTSDVDALNELLDEGLDGLLTALFSIMTIGIVLIVLDPPLGLVTMLAFPLLLLLGRWFQKNSAKAYRRTRETVAMVIVQFVESLGGIRAVHAFRREPRDTEIFRTLNEDNRKAQDRAFWLMSIFVPGVQLIGNLVTVGVLMYGAIRVMDGDLKIGVLTAFLLYIRRFFDPMSDLAMFYNSYQSAVAALEKLSGVLEEQSSVAPAQDPEPLEQAHGDVRFDGVQFGYGDAIVLPQLDLHIPQGQTIALVGATGAGKSTLARLAGRFYDPREGSVSLDGVDLRRLSDEDLRRAVVMVTQESFLFSGSVADNIGFGRPGASRAEVEHAARAIGADEFIQRLPEGYDTDVRKRGGRLSAGQRQLVSFARAFLADPAVLILDEATSSLDVPSERLVQRALGTILADRTAIIIAHRLSTVEIADRVLVMDAGRLIEDGSPYDLLAGSGRFADLHTAWRDSLA